MALSTAEIVGREAELATLEAFLGGPLPAALVFDGEAGIGKTTLWLAGVELARDRGHTVLACSPAEAEAELSFAALRDLFDDAFDTVAAELSAPLRTALGAALLRNESTTVLDPGAVAAAVSGGLRLLAAERTVVVAVDDVQWLDRASAATLEFALRRLRSERVGVLIGRRAAPETGLPLGLGRAFPEATVTLVAVEGLTLGALHRLLRNRVGVSLPRRTLVRVHETSAGNPFFALELARLAGREPDRFAPVADVPFSGGIRELAAGRLSTLPDATRTALLTAALAGSPTMDLIARVVGGDAHLEPAVSAEVVEITDGDVRFVHPLLRSAAVDAAEPGRRLAVHARLATLAEDAEERARHLALAADGPSAEAASALEAAAELARRRGSMLGAAELLDRARLLTPGDDIDAWARRTLAAGEAYARAGDESAGHALAREVGDRVPSGDNRARALTQLGFWLTNEELCDQALAETDNASLRAHALYVRAYTRSMTTGPEGVLTDAAEASKLAAEVGDERLRVQSEAILGWAEGASGLRDPLPRHLAAIELEKRLPDVPLLLSPRSFAGDWYSSRLHDLEQARDAYEAVLRRAEETGDEEARAVTCNRLIDVELKAGNWSRASAYVNELAEFFELESDAVAGREVLHHARARLLAHRGDLDRALDEAERGARLAAELGRTGWEAQNRAVCGFAELSRDDADAALRWLDSIPVLLERIRMPEPAEGFGVPDRAEALIAAGRLSEAESAVAELEPWTRRKDRPRIAARAFRCVGLLLSAKGDLDAADAALEEALAGEERAPMPFERGRAVFELGRVRRRRNRRREARTLLGEAAAVFADLGARAWEEKARRELARVGGRTRAAEGELTPTERRVAELVAEGRSNREVAAKLFVSAKTVDVYLTRIYAKLGIHSRTELARRVFEEGRAGKL